jgi:hypothetical protein
LDRDISWKTPDPAEPSGKPPQERTSDGQNDPNDHHDSANLLHWKNRIEEFEEFKEFIIGTDGTGLIFDLGAQPVILAILVGRRPLNSLNS